LIQPTRSPSSFWVALSLMIFLLTQRFDRGHGAGVQGAFDVAEQDDAVVAGGVLGVVQIGLVEQQALALVPVVRFRHR